MIATDSPGVVMDRGKRKDFKRLGFRKAGLSRADLAAISTAAFLISALSLAALPGRVRGDEAKKPATPPAAKPAKSKAEKQKAIAARQERLKKKMEREQAKNPDPENEKVDLPPRPVKSVTPPTLTSSELDRLVRDHLAATGPKVEPAPLTNDVEFVRRIYFDLTGQPPTTSQLQAFLRDASKEKRARLIDHLLATPEFATNWSRYWRDVIKFRATGQNTARVGYPALEDWLTLQLKKNAPWDEIATGLITASGRNDENGAVGFALAHEAQPVELAGEVSRVFLGIQIQCAQCHDHKTDAWKQRQFHEFAAFFAGGRQRLVEKAAPGKPPVFGVAVQGKPRYTYTKADDPKTQIPLAPKFFLASTSAPADAKSADGSQPVGELPIDLNAEARRRIAASYITGQDNPWFAKAFVNRTWYALMGEAFYAPIDDIGPERDVKALAVLDPLATQWQRGGYDIRWLFRTILNTEAYQRRIRSTSSAAGKTAFASNCPSRLRSDQIFGALAHALGFPAEVGNDPAVLAARMARVAQAKAKSEAKGDDAGKKKPVGTLASLKSLGEAPEKPGEMKPGEMKKGAVKKLIEATGLPAAVAKGARRPGFTPLVLFNNLFGADPSLENDEVLGTIPQALFMMNSPLINQKTQAKPGNVLNEILKSAPNDRAALGALYVRVLSRQPTPKEVETCAHYLTAVGDRTEAFEDIYWTLINSTEFITRR